MKVRFPVGTLAGASARVVDRSAPGRAAFFLNASGPRTESGEHLEERRFNPGPHRWRATSIWGRVPKAAKPGPRGFVVAKCRDRGAPRLMLPAVVSRPGAERLVRQGGPDAVSRQCAALHLTHDACVGVVLYRLRFLYAPVVETCRLSLNWPDGDDACPDASNALVVDRVRSAERWRCVLDRPSSRRADICLMNRDGRPRRVTWIVF